MKISEAIILGSGAIKMEPAEITSCALGAAGYTVGKHGYNAILKQWPWLNAFDEKKWNYYWLSVCKRFDHEVCEGKITLDEFVAWVRSVEPECGECNQFECTCVKEATGQSCEIACV